MNIFGVLFQLRMEPKKKQDPPLNSKEKLLANEIIKEDAGGREGDKMKNVTTKLK